MNVDLECKIVYLHFKKMFQKVLTVLMCLRKSPCEQSYITDGQNDFFFKLKKSLRFLFNFTCLLNLVVSTSKRKKKRKYRLTHKTHELADIISVLNK